jgi:hypothetical protein
MDALHACAVPAETLPDRGREHRRWPDDAVAGTTLTVPTLWSWCPELEQIPCVQADSTEHGSALAEHLVESNVLDARQVHLRVHLPGLELSSDNDGLQIAVAEAAAVDDRQHRHDVVDGRGARCSQGDDRALDIGLSEFEATIRPE